MGERTADLSIDRIDVNGNYTPENCKWSTALELTLNRRCMGMSPEEIAAYLENERRLEEEELHPY